MKVYNKILNGVYLSVAIFIILVLVLSNTILVNQFDNIEKDSIISNVKRVNNAMYGEIDTLSAVMKDYAKSDNAYNFSVNKDKKYIPLTFDSNAMFKKYRINFVIYMDKEGKIILSKDYNLNEQTQNILSSKLEKEITLKAAHLLKVKRLERIKGISEINNIPTILIIEPITTTDGTKSSGSYMITGRYLDSLQTSLFSSAAEFNLSMDKYNKTLQNNKNIEWNNNIAIENINDTTSIGYSILPDIENNPCLVFKITIVRKIYGQARKSIVYFIVFLILISLIFIGIGLIYLNKVVAKRIIKMNIIISKISETKNLNMRMKADGKDEIAFLASGFNHMLDVLGSYKNNIEISKNKYHSLISNMLSCFSYIKVIFNKDGIPIEFLILDANNALINYIKLQREEIIGKKISDFVDITKLNIDIFKIFVDVARHSGEKKIDEIYFDIGEKWFTITVYSIEEGHFALMFSDITEKKKVEQKILELVNRDSLTGLPNRKMVMENIKSTIGKSQNDGNKFAVLFIDLDDFKRVNDNLGHGVGDIIIQKVAVRLKNIISPTDVVARLGGDEFIILQSNISSEGDAENLAIRIRNVLKESFIHMDNEMYIAASIGISMYPRDGEDVSILMKNSDIAMYKAKKSGGNCHRVYLGDMNTAGLTNLMLESNLYKSLERKEMLLYYQAITHVDSKTVIGFEALIRWNRDDKIIPPSEFIPMAENNGFIIELGEWVLREACKQCSEWNKSGMETYVTVNITFKQLEQYDFIDIIISSLKEADMDSKYLVLEITENDAMQNFELAIETLNKVKKLGVRIALDDFGTGYSSLSYVNRFPVDIIKIDKSLINNITKETHDIAIIKAIIAMAASLGMKVVVEGVEDIKQFIMLKEIKTYAIQGYLISKPIPAKDIKNFIERKIKLQ